MSKTSLLLLLSISALFVSCDNDENVITKTCSSFSQIEDCLSDTYEINPLSVANKKVLLVGIDGVRSDAVQSEITPFLASFSEKENTFFNVENKVEDLTFSGPNWSSILTGVHYCKHEVTDNAYTNHRLGDYPHFFHHLENADANFRTVSLANWQPINEFTAAAHADFANTDYMEDAAILELAKSVLTDETPAAADALFVYFEMPDLAGHDYGFSPDVPEYAQTMSEVDGQVEQLYALIEAKRAEGENWLFIVVSDHGGEGTGHHGGQNNPNINQTILLLENPQLNFKNSASEQVDIVPSIFDFYDLESSQFNCVTDGVSLIE